jgi:peptide/nickel transport system substrate-binding protein
MTSSSVIRALLLAVAVAAAPLAAKTLRWSSQGDILTMDPHSQNEGLNNSWADHVYETLVTADKATQGRALPRRVVGASEPHVTRFKLRPNVKFHDGSPFTADDVVFSIQRANMETSRFALPRGREGARKVDDLTVEIVTEKPVPVLIPQLTKVRIMSKAWAHETQRAEAQDFAGKEETYASRNANGTGPFILKTREADVKTVLVLNSNWWGKREGNVTEVVYLPIKQDSTRLAALLSGEIDLMLDPPPQDIPRLKQDPKIKVVEGNENRTIFFGMDQYRDELLYSGVKGKNPFKDKRVREAFQAAIDVNAIKTQVMRGLPCPRR